MSLRTRLILAFVLLSVVPLTAVTLYSYVSSVHAFEDAVQREESRSAADIGHRMTLVTDDVGQRLDRVFDSTATTGTATGDEQAEAVRARLAPMLGDVAAFVDRIEFHPMAPAPPEGAAHTVPDVPAAPSAPSAPPAPPAAPAAPAPPVPPAMVVNVPELLNKTLGQLRDSGVLDKEQERQLNERLHQSMAAHEADMKAAAAAIASGIADAAKRESSATAPAAKLEGHTLAVPVRRHGRMVGQASARLNLDRTLGAILTLSRSDQGEIPFAIDRTGQLYTPDATNRGTLQNLHVADVAASGTSGRVGDWLVVARKDPSGLTFGIARPLGESLREIRRASVRNLTLGLAVIGLAILGIVPVSHRMTDRLRALTAGVQRLAGGDFRARVPVKSDDEFGRLANAFNQMAGDLERHQAAAVEQERLRRELELSRQIQTDMLPRAPLKLGAAEIKGISIPAREVGGDFFNYFELPEHRLGLLVGDVSGKGVSAALLMANVQATLRARLPLQTDLAALADLLDRELDDSTPGGVFVTAFIAVLDDGGRSMRYVNAGHHPQYVLRAGGGIDRLTATGLPIGLFAGHGYTEARVSLSSGDTLFFYTDGLVEMENERGEMFGHERLEGLLLAEHAVRVDGILQSVDEQVRTFRGTAEPLDDATIMVLRV